MRIATLIGIEWLKTRQRVAFWAASLSFFTLILIGLGSSYYFASRAGRAIGDPLWEGLTGSASIGLLVVLVAIVLLTASERTWRTERQNVIDGLSRTQYFVGKLMLVIGFVLLLWLGGILLTAIFELLNRSLPGAVEHPFITRADAVGLGTLFLYLLLAGTIGLFFGTVSATSGAGLALAFLFLMLQAPIMFLMARQGGLWQEVTAYLPMQVLQNLLEPLSAADHAARDAMLRQNGIPLSLTARTNLLVALLYGLLFCAGAWYSIRRRDL